MNYRFIHDRTDLISLLISFREIENYERTAIILGALHAHCHISSSHK